MKGLIIFLFCLLVGIWACGGETSKYSELDLLEYGFPLKIEAPEDVKIETEKLLMYKGISIKDDDKYDLVIYQMEATQSPEKTIEEQKSLVEDNPYFVEFVEEDEYGFIYKTAVDSTYENFNFRYVKRFGENEFLFQAGLINQFKEPEIRTLYNIAVESE